MTQKVYLGTAKLAQRNCCPCCLFEDAIEAIRQELPVQRLADEDNLRDTLLSLLRHARQTFQSRLLGQAFYQTYAHVRVWRRFSPGPFQSRTQQTKQNISREGHFSLLESQVARSSSDSLFRLAASEEQLASFKSQSLHLRRGPLQISALQTSDMHMDNMHAGAPFIHLGPSNAWAKASITPNHPQRNLIQVTVLSGRTDPPCRAIPIAFLSFSGIAGYRAIPPQIHPITAKGGEGVSHSLWGVSHYSEASQL